MFELSEKQIADFYYRSYTAVDGLWFMKVEEKYGFDKALETDNAVWKVLPKIQARMLKSMSKMGSGMEALYQCFTAKLNLDGFSFKAERSEGCGGFRIIVERCPWHDLMVKSGRESLSEKVGSLICDTEYSVWASEFGDDIRFELQNRICKGSESCILQFGHNPSPPAFSK